MNKHQRDEEDERSEDTPVVAEPESFGTWLRRQREVREIDLREIADSSKVSMSYLQAFEDDRFDVLPSPVFAKGFLRQYARYVGLDPEEVVNFYLAARHPEGEAEPELQPRTSSETPSRRYLVVALAVAVALLLGVGLLSKYGDQLGLAAPWGAAPEPSRPVEELAEPAPPAEQPEIEPPTQASLVESPDETVAALAEPEAPIRVTLDFMSDCWVEASVDGVKTLSQLNVQGESLLLTAEEVVEFKVGDVNAVQVEVNGSPYEIENREGTSVRTVRVDLEAIARAGEVEAAPQPSPQDERTQDTES